MHAPRTCYLRIMVKGFAVACRIGCAHYAYFSIERSSPHRLPRGSALRCRRLSPEKQAHAGSWMVSSWQEMGVCRVGTQSTQQQHPLRNENTNEHRTVTYSLRTVQIDPEMGTVNKGKEIYCKSRQPRVHCLDGLATRLSTRTACHFPLRTLCALIIHLRGIFYCAQYTHEAVYVHTETIPFLPCPTHNLATPSQLLVYHPDVSDSHLGCFQFLL